MRPTTLVLLPGMDGTGELFRPLIEHLPSDVRPVIVRYPHLARYDELLPMIMTALPASRFMLLGESFSGPLALMAAGAGPQSLAGVILCASYAQNPLPRAATLFQPLLGAWLFRFTPKLLRDRLLLGAGADPQVRRLVGAVIATVPPSVLAARVRQAWQTDVRTHLRRCSAPLLYLQATQDRLINSRRGAEVLAIAPAAKIESIDGPHLLLQSTPAAAAEVICRFIEGLDSGTAL